MTIDQFARGFRPRVLVVLGILVLMHVALIGRLWFEQVRLGEDHREAISKQSIRRLRLAPVRGRIISSDGELFTDNIPSYDVLLHIAEMRQPKRKDGPTTEEYVAQTIERIVELLGRDKEVTDDQLMWLSKLDARARKRDVKKDQQAGLLEVLKVSRDPGVANHFLAARLPAEQRLFAYRLLTYMEVRRHMRVYPALAYRAFTDLTTDELARLSTAMPPIPGLEISTQMVRIYPQGDVGAHLIGFVGRRSPKEEPDRDQYYYYRPELAGQTGLEEAYDSYLRGQGGARLMRVDSMGMFYDEVEEIQTPHRGADLLLNLDGRAMHIAQDLMRGQRGALVLLDSHTGAVLAMVSSPSYDLRLLSRETYGQWAKDTVNRPLVNRALSGGYMSGSIIKPLVALAALQNGVIDPLHTVNCPGYYQLGDTRIRCSRHSGHGVIDLAKAIEVSCNTYFISVGLETTVDKLEPEFASAGIGQPTGIELGQSGDEGLLPSREVKREMTGKAWLAGDTALVSIGQGRIGVSPVQAATYAAAIANGGLLLRPRLVKAIRDSNGKYIQVTRPEVRGQLEASEQNLLIVREAMHRVVWGEDASAPAARNDVIDLAGKTGTAELGTRANRRKNTWFICFGPYDSPRYAMAVLVEDGVSGGKTAAPIARKFFELWLQGGQSIN